MMKHQVFIHEVMLISICLQIIADGNMIYTTYDDEGRETNGIFKCISFAKLKCVASAKPSIIRWRIAETVSTTTTAAAGCIGTSCTATNNFSGRYVYEYNESANSSTLSISTVHLNETRLQYLCDDGLSSNYFQPVIKAFPNESSTHFDLIMKKPVNELIITTSCTRLDKNVTFTWYKTKKKDGSDPIFLKTTDYTTNDTYCSPDDNCGGHGLSSILQFSEEVNGEMFFIMCIIYVQDIGSPGPLQKIFTSKRFALSGGRDCCKCWSYMFTVIAVVVLGYIACAAIKLSIEKRSQKGLNNKLCTALVGNFIFWNGLAIIWDIIGICLIKTETVCVEECCVLECWVILLIILIVTIILVFIEWYLIEPIRDLREDNQNQSKICVEIKWKMCFNNKNFTISLKKSKDQIWGKEIPVPSQKLKDGYFTFCIYDVLPNTAYDVKVMYRLCNACPVISSATTSFTFKCFETNHSGRVVDDMVKANINQFRLESIKQDNDKTKSPKKRGKKKRSNKKDRNDISREKAKDNASDTHSMDLKNDCVTNAVEGLSNGNNLPDIEETVNQETYQTLDTENFSQDQYTSGSLIRGHLRSLPLPDIPKPDKQSKKEVTQM